MSKAKVLKVINPLIGLLVLSQVVTGMNADKLGPKFEPAHVLPGFLLAILVLVHLILNWSWVRANYFKGSRTQS